MKAATHYQDPKVLLEVSENLTGAMKGLAVAGLDESLTFRLKDGSFQMDPYDP